jgi:hypothetical protein
MGCFLLACVLENQKMEEEEAIWDDRFAESEEEGVVGVCWYCGDKLREGYDRAPLCWECRGEEELVEATGLGTYIRSSSLLLM